MSNSQTTIVSLFCLLARVTLNIHVILRKMAKPREKVRNTMLHNYDSARYLASKVIEAIENTHVTVGINDFLAGRDSTHQARSKRTHL